MPAIYHEGSWLGNATDPEVLVKDTVGWTGKNIAYSQTNNAVIAHIESGITYDVSWTGSATVTLKKNSASGATITSGSTSPLSFTADADYELYFGSSATVTNIMVKDSRITDPTYEPYHESVEVMYEEEIHGVNLLNVTASTQTINGVTFTVNSDKSVRVVANNTSVYSALTLNSNLAEILEVGQSYVLTGTPIKPSGTSYRQYELRIRKNSNNDLVASDTGSGVKFTLTQAMVQADTYRLDIAIFDGTTCDTVFYPMIRKADIEDPTYRPYNPQAIQNQLNAQGVLGAKNLFNQVYKTITQRGVTFTANSDGTVTASGTATGGNAAISEWDKRLTLPKGRYIWSGCPTGGSYFTFASMVQDTSADPVQSMFDYGNGVEFEVTDETHLYAFYLGWVKEGATVNNVTFKPMLRLASDPDDTYQPYAMTNRELTEEVSGKNLTISTTNNSITLGAETYCKIFGSIIIGSLQFTTSAEIAKYSNIASIAYGAVPVNKGKFMFAAISTSKDVYRVTIEAGNTSNMGVWVNDAIPTGKTCKFTFVLFV